MILFSAPMVRALLAGTKTQTRRILTGACDEPPAFIENGAVFALNENNVPYRWPKTHATGDRLWVREAWRTPSSWDDRSPSQLVASCIEAGYKTAWAPIAWEADGTTTNWADWRVKKNGRLRASMHLPRAFSRITLTVTDVRVQRLQDISEADAIAEGCDARPFPGPWWQGYISINGDLMHQVVLGDCPPEWMIDPKKMAPTPWLDKSASDEYRTLWNSINGPGAWEANPWVAAYTFTVEHRNIDAALSEGGR